MARPVQRRQTSEPHTTLLLSPTVTSERRLKPKSIFRSTRKTSSAGLLLEDPLLDAVKQLHIGAHHYLKQGVSLEAAGHLAQAAAEHERALEIDPKLEQAHINLISLYGRLGQPAKAETHYKAY